MKRAAPDFPVAARYFWGMRKLHESILLCMALLFLPSITVRAAGPYQDPAQPLGGPVPAVPVSLVSTAEPQRLVAASLALTLGAFGAHRLYLGTDAKVPIIYGLTFGGFGVLVLIDLVHVLCTKDLRAYQANGQVFMWAKGPPGQLTPP